MRLIDADALKQSVTIEMLKAELNSPVYCTLECVIADIEIQPTAFDLDKVIWQLQEYADDSVIYAVKGAWESAIAIVKKGGACVMAYKNPIPNVDDETVSEKYCITFSFSGGVTKEEAHKSINELIEKYGGKIPASWIKMGHQDSLESRMRNEKVF